MMYSLTMTVLNDAAVTAWNILHPLDLETNPKEARLYLMHGVITKVIFRPRPGHASVLHVKVFHGRHQVFPSSGDDDLHGDDHPIQWDEWYEVPEKPFYLEIWARNDSTRYPHTFDIAFAVIPRWATVPFAMAKSISDFINVLSPRNISLPTWLGGKKK